MRLQADDASDFHVSQDGVVYTLNRAGPGEKISLIYARDPHTRQIWKTRVRLLVQPDSERNGQVGVAQFFLSPLN